MPVLTGLSLGYTGCPAGVHGAGARKLQKRGRKELHGVEGVVLRGVARNNAISAAEGPGCDGNDHNRAFCPPETNVLCQTVSF